MMIQAPNRQVRIASTTGHTVILEPGEKRELAQHLAVLALQKGCYLAAPEGSPEPVSAPAPSEPEEAPLDFGSAFAEVDPDDDSPDARAAGIEAAIKELIARNDPTAFTGEGQPRVRDVAVILGYAVSRSEVEEVFSTMNVSV
jgi:hypothetical protein